MDNLFVIREKMRELYAAHSRVFDKGIQFVLALVTFYLINGNVGFMKAAASPVATALPSSSIPAPSRARTR